MRTGSVRYRVAERYELAVEPRLEAAVGVV